MDHQQRFNKWLARRRRIELGLSVEAVASYVGKSTKSIYAYENERQDVSPPPRVRRDLERLYDVEIGELLRSYETVA